MTEGLDEFFALTYAIAVGSSTAISILTSAIAFSKSMFLFCDRSNARIMNLPASITL